MGSLVVNSTPKDISAQLSHWDARTRAAARMHLVEMGPEALPHLLAKLDARDWHARWEACKALGDIGDKSSAEPLARMLLDDDTSVRWAAMGALIQMGRSAIHPLMLALTRDFSSARLRQGAHHVLHTLFNQGVLTQEEVLVFRALEGATSGIQAASLANQVLIGQIR